MSGETVENGKFRVIIRHRIEKFDGDPAPGDQPLEVIEIIEEIEDGIDDCVS